MAYFPAVRRLPGSTRDNKIPCGEVTRLADNTIPCGEDLSISESSRYVCTIDPNRCYQLLRQTAYLYLQQLEQNLSDSLVRCSNKQHKSNASVSFDLSGDSLWRPRQETSQRTQQFRQPQSGPRGEHQEYLTTPSDEEQHHQLTGDGARQLTSPQPTSPQLQPVAEGTLELLLRQMQKDREASNRNMESLVQALASNTQRKACMDAIPQCPQMQHKEDIVEYLQVFEETQLARGNPKEHWCHTLISLLNKNCKAVVVGLPPSTKYNYKLLKAELLATASHKHRQSSKDFWEHEKKSGSTWREVANALTKKIRLFTPGPTPEDVRNQVATEKLIQLLPFKAQAFVREREPKTVTEAADLASSYFYSHNMDESHWETHIYKHKPATSKTASKKNNRITLISNIKANHIILINTTVSRPTSPITLMTSTRLNLQIHSLIPLQRKVIHTLINKVTVHVITRILKKVTPQR